MAMCGSGFPMFQLGVKAPENTHKHQDTVAAMIFRNDGPILSPFYTSICCWTFFSHDLLS